LVFQQSSGEPVRALSFLTIICFYRPFPVVWWGIKSVSKESHRTMARAHSMLKTT